MAKPRTSIFDEPMYWARMSWLCARRAAQERVDEKMAQLDAVIRETRERPYVEYV